MPIYKNLHYVGQIRRFAQFWDADVLSLVLHFLVSRSYLALRIVHFSFLIFHFLFHSSCVKKRHKKSDFISVFMRIWIEKGWISDREKEVNKICMAARESGRGRRNKEAHSFKREQPATAERIRERAGQKSQARAGCNYSQPHTVFLADLCMLSPKGITIRKSLKTTKTVFLIPFEWQLYWKSVWNLGVPIGFKRFFDRPTHRSPLLLARTRTYAPRERERESSVLHLRTYSAVEWAVIHLCADDFL